MFEGKRIISYHYTSGLVAGKPLQIEIHYTGGVVLFTDPGDVAKIMSWIQEAKQLKAVPCEYLQYMFTNERL